MRRLVLATFALSLLAGCQPATVELTEEQKAEIAAAVRQVFEDEIAAANEADFERITSHMSEQDGICLYGTTIQSCSEAKEAAWQVHSQEAEVSLVRQEADGEETRVVVLSSAVALVANTVQENRAYFSDGAVMRGRFASLIVYVKENGEWKNHSSQEVSWPIEDDGDDQN